MGADLSARKWDAGRQPGSKACKPGFDEGPAVVVVANSLRLMIKACAIRNMWKLKSGEHARVSEKIASSGSTGAAQAASAGELVHARRVKDVFLDWGLLEAAKLYLKVYVCTYGVARLSVTSAW